MQKGGIESSTEDACSTWEEEIKKDFYFVPKSIESVIASVDLDGDGASVSFGHAPVALHDNQFGPDLVVNLVPFV